MYAQRDSAKISASLNTHANLFTRFDVVMLDAMNTVFLAKGGKYYLYEKLLEGFGINVDTPKLAEVYDRKRAYFEKMAKDAERTGQKTNVPKMWARINASIIIELAPGKLLRGSEEETGKKMHDQFLGSPDSFRIHDDMLQFLQIAHGNISVVIASNHRKGYLPKFISSFNLEPLIDGLFISEKIGFEKPDPRFFHAIIEAMSNKIPSLSPDRMLMVGNNIINDVKGANEAGITHAIFLNWEKDQRCDKTIQTISSPLELLRMEFPT